MNELNELNEQNNKHTTHILENCKVTWLLKLSLLPKHTTWIYFESSNAAHLEGNYQRKSGHIFFTIFQRKLFKHNAFFRTPLFPVDLISMYYNVSKTSLNLQLNQQKLLPLIMVQSVKHLLLYRKLPPLLKVQQNVNWCY